MEALQGAWVLKQMHGEAELCVFLQFWEEEGSVWGFSVFSDLIGRFNNGGGRLISTLQLPRMRDKRQKLQHWKF